MRTTHRLLVASTVAGFVACSGPVLAQKEPDHSAHHSESTGKTPAAEMSEGEVRKLDKANSKITLKHGPIRNLDMPAMTMVFLVPDATLLDKVKVGDRVRFAAANPGGKLTLTDIRQAQ